MIFYIFDNISGPLNSTQIIQKYQGCWVKLEHVLMQSNHLSENAYL